MLGQGVRSEEHTSELQSHLNLVCRLLLEKKKIHEYYYYLCHSLCTSLYLRVCVARLTYARDSAMLTDALPTALYYQSCFFFFFNDTAPPEIYTLPLHDALPISHRETHTHTHTSTPPPHTHTSAQKAVS